MARVRKETQPTDQEVLAAVSAHGVSGSGAMTYVIRNRLASKFRGIQTSAVRRQLQRMERAGKVKRVPSIYARQICWMPT